MFFIKFLFTMLNLNKKIFLVRHAQSMANVGLKTENPQNNHLTELGKIQANELLNKIKEVPDYICYSKYVRTLETAAPLINKYPNVKHELWENIHEFTYLNHKNCANTTPEQRRPLVIKYWEKLDPFYSDGDNAESFHEFIIRIKDTLEKIKTLPYKNIYIFTHGQFIAATKIVYNNMEKSDLEIMILFFEDKRGLTISNCEIVEL